MVDVGDKDATRRAAVAEGWIHLQPATLQRIVAGAHAKGDVLGVARIAVSYTHLDVYKRQTNSMDNIWKDTA